MWALYASHTVFAILSLIGTAIINPVNMSIHMSMKRFPLEVTGKIGPTRSMQINCIGTSGTLKSLNSPEVFAWFRQHTLFTCFAMFENVAFHTRPIVHFLQSHVCTSTSIVAILVMCQYKQWVS